MGRPLTRLLAASALCMGLLGACASPPVASDYAQEKPVLDIAQYFNGTIDAWGMFTDRSGRVVKRFTVVMNCRWDGNVGTLDEDFTYSDGSSQKRSWTLTKTGNAVVGKAADVVGEATGLQAGNAFNMKYTLQVPVDGKTYDMQFDDWMYLMDEKTMLNRAVMSKFGIELGQVTLSFRKRN
ncbi:DUF3833 domain-containing protein [Limnobacter humi]|uniref:DUF3833 domain-containing protein n=2 Tax=Limnobacter humi TaxID=1778671 RepID=A0ABT1WBM2_9BURK|nr:DUF3833 domain-containing protein [Limnobacter humi]MCQ8894916.1 DUF3833 domain-containing protein [Limnobacter humi]